jgi:hypothetical protein
MNIVLQRNIGALVALVTSVRPQSSGAATINGVAIDRFAHNLSGSCVLEQTVGAISGAPTTSSVVTKLQHSPDGTTWSDFQIGGATQQTAAATAQNTEQSVAIELTDANRFVRAVTTVAFTGGTSPAALVAALLVLAGQDRLPAV